MLLCQPMHHFPDHGRNGNGAALFWQNGCIRLDKQIIQPGIRCRLRTMGYPTRYPDPAIGRHDPYFFVCGAGNRAMQRNNQLAFAMAMDRDFRLLVAKVELPRKRWQITEIRVIGKIGGLQAIHHWQD
jgi:hypothetical protein